LEERKSNVVKGERVAEKVELKSKLRRAGEGAGQGRKSAEER
jgi:hypothetical protein